MYEEYRNTRVVKYGFRQAKHSSLAARIKMCNLVKESMGDWKKESVHVSVNRIYTNILVDWGSQYAQHTCDIAAYRRCIGASESSWHAAWRKPNAPPRLVTGSCWRQKLYLLRFHLSAKWRIVQLLEHNHNMGGEKRQYIVLAPKQDSTLFFCAQVYILWGGVHSCFADRTC